MKISDILVEKTPHLSFEVFPPKTDAAYEGVLKATEAIAELKPSYMSVTYGAGGGTSKNTVKIASHKPCTSYLCIINKRRSTSGNRSVKGIRN